MIVDLIHNKIVRETVTDAFERGITERVLPVLAEKYGEALAGVQMYEDYLSDGFLVDGVQYYPLTVILDGEQVTEWICWEVDKSSFKDGIPYSYVGEGVPEICFAENSELTDGFEARIAGRAKYCEAGVVNIRVEAAALAPIFLSGKYSQTFIDEMSRQITPAIEAAMSVTGLSDSGLELSLIFAPETYMEHTSENVTYRRLVLSDKTSMPRDLWIKWTRLDGATAYSVADHVGADNILFELGEDVPQKIREKEYRFLLRMGKDKYHNAMGRRNITEWREMIKRAVRRGELLKVEPTVILSEQATDLSAEFARVLGMSDTASAPIAEPVASYDDEAVRLARELLGLRSEETQNEQAAEEYEETAPEAYEEEEDGDRAEAANENDEALIVSFEETDEPAEDEPAQTDEVVFDESDEADSEVELDPTAEIYEEDDELTLSELRALDPDDDDADELLPDDEPVEDESAAPVSDEPLDPTSEIYEDDVADQPASVIEEKPDRDVASEPTVSAAELEARIRAEVEAKVRLEYEREARIRAEQEMERMKRAQEQLRAENERLLAEAERRKAEMAAELEARARREAIEQERMAEAAKLAVEEQRRIEAERAREEQIRAEEAARLEQERLRFEEERRLEAERAAERERIIREAEERAMSARVPREEPADEPAVESEPESASEAEPVCVSKTVRLIFRRHVDPNVTGRMQEIIKATVSYYGKENVPLRIRATVPDDTTVCLEFLRIPEGEMELLSNIIKVLGNSGLGIAKAVVD